MTSPQATPELARVISNSEQSITSEPALIGWLAFGTRESEARSFAPFKEELTALAWSVRRNRDDQSVPATNS